MLIAHHDVRIELPHNLTERREYSLVNCREQKLRISNEVVIDRLKHPPEFRNLLRNRIVHIPCNRWFSWCIDLSEFREYRFNESHHPLIEAIFRAQKFLFRPFNILFAERYGVLRSDEFCANRHERLAKDLDEQFEGLLDHRLKPRLGLIGHLTLLTDGCEDDLFAIELEIEGLLELTDPIHSHRIEVSVGSGIDDGDLLLERHGRVYILFEDLNHTLSSFEITASIGIKIGRKLTECLKFAELREGELECSGNLLHRLGLSRTSDARN